MTSSTDDDIPPYCFSSIDELTKYQIHYNLYNVFHVVERLHLLTTRGTCCSTLFDRPIDKSSMLYKMYKDLILPPPPPRYEYLNLPPQWLIYLVVSKQKKRVHRKSYGLIPFKELAQKIADCYKSIDPITRYWCEEVAKQVLKYNGEMKEAFFSNIKLRRSKEEADSNPTDNLMLLSFQGNSHIPMMNSSFERTLNEDIPLKVRYGSFHTDQRLNVTSTMQDFEPLNTPSIATRNIQDLFDHKFSPVYNREYNLGESRAISNTVSLDLLSHENWNEDRGFKDHGEVPYPKSPPKKKRRLAKSNKGLEKSKMQPKKKAISDVTSITAFSERGNLDSLAEAANIVMTTRGHEYHSLAEAPIPYVPMRAALNAINFHCTKDDTIGTVRLCNPHPYLHHTSDTKAKSLQTCAGFIDNIMVQRYHNSEGNLTDTLQLLNHPPLPIPYPIPDFFSQLRTEVIDKIALQRNFRMRAERLDAIHLSNLHSTLYRLSDARSRSLKSYTEFIDNLILQRQLDTRG